MKITGKKLAEALSALGKLITRTSPVELHQAVLLEARDGQLSLRTVAQDESLTVTIPAEGAADFRHAVHYARLRELARNPAGTVTFMELNDGFAVRLEGRRKIVTYALPVLNIDWPEAEVAPAEAETASLPENFTALLSEAAPLVNRNEARHQLRGIHLCPEGIVVTDGKQLLHLPLDWTLKSLVTLPFPLALLTAKPKAPGTLTVWKLKDVQFFKIEVGGFLWSGKAVSGSYPEWRKVIPEASALNYAIAFSPEQAAQLTGFLKTVPDHEPFHAVELNVVPGGVTVIPNNFPDMELRLEATVIGADFELHGGRVDRNDRHSIGSHIEFDPVERLMIGNRLQKRNNLFRVVEFDLIIEAFIGGNHLFPIGEVTRQYLALPQKVADFNTEQPLVLSTPDVQHSRFIRSGSQ